MQPYTEDTSLCIVYAPGRDAAPWPFRALLSQDCYLIDADQYSTARYGPCLHPLRRPIQDAAGGSLDAVYLCFHPRKVCSYIDDDQGYQNRLLRPDETVEHEYQANRGHKIPLQMLLVDRSGATHALHV